jgi:hypothetical protein
VAIHAAASTNGGLDPQNAILAAQQASQSGIVIVAKGHAGSVSRKPLPRHPSPVTCG